MRAPPVVWRRCDTAVGSPAAYRALADAHRRCGARAEDARASSWTYPAGATGGGSGRRVPGVRPRAQAQPRAPAASVVRSRSSRCRAPAHGSVGVSDSPTVRGGPHLALMSATGRRRTPSGVCADERTSASHPGVLSSPETRSPGGSAAHAERRPSRPLPLPIIADPHATAADDVELGAGRAAGHRRGLA
jgi:hypothetical protein